MTEKVPIRVCVDCGRHTRLWMRDPGDHGYRCPFCMRKHLEELKAEKAKPPKTDA